MVRPEILGFTRDMTENSKPTALVVVSHHRSDSLTAAIAARATDRLAEAGYRVDVLNLHEAEWDPRGIVADDPQYDDPKPRYSAETHEHARRLHRAEVIVPVFPVWWFGMPALLKGWIDRVWNHGLTYGVKPNPMAGRKLLWVALAGVPDWDDNADLVRFLMDETITRGISQYCGVPDTQTLTLWHTEATGLDAGERERHYRDMFTRVDEAVSKRLAG